MIEIIEDVSTEKYKSSYVENYSYDKSKQTLEKEGYRILNLNENINLKVYGKPLQDDLTLWEQGNWVKPWIIYSRDKGRFIIPDIPKNETNGELIAHYRTYGQYSLDLDQINKSLENHIKLPNNLKSVFTRNLWRSELFRKLIEKEWIEKEEVIELGHILKHKGINKFNFKFYSQGEADKIIKDVKGNFDGFAYPLWFGTDGFNGYHDLLMGRMRGIKEV